MATHNWWLGLTPDEILAELAQHESVDFGPPADTEFDGLPATVVEATTSRLVALWNDRRNPGRGGVFAGWWLEPGQRVRLIIVKTSAGSRSPLNPVTR